MPSFKTLNSLSMMKDSSVSPLSSSSPLSVSQRIEWALKSPRITEFRVAGMIAVLRSSVPGACARDDWGGQYTFVSFIHFPFFILIDIVVVSVPVFVSFFSGRKLTELRT